MIWLANKTNETLLMESAEMPHTQRKEVITFVNKAQDNNF